MVLIPVFFQQWNCSLLQQTIKPAFNLECKVCHILTSMLNLKIMSNHTAFADTCFFVLLSNLSPSTYSNLQQLAERALQNGQHDYCFICWQAWHCAFIFQTSIYMPVHGYQTMCTGPASSGNRRVVGEHELHRPTPSRGSGKGETFLRYGHGSVELGVCSLCFVQTTNMFVGISVCTQGCGT